MTSIMISRLARSTFVLALLLPLTVAEAGTKSTGTTAAGQELPSSQMAPLTAGECKRLGGTVSTNKKCKQGKDCTVSHLNGAMHTICVDEVEQ